MPDQFLFPSQQTDSPDGFAGYRHLYSTISDVDRTQVPFGARVTVCPFNNMLVFDRHLSGIRHTRGPARVRRDGFEHINMQLVLDGSLHGGPLGEERLVRPGEIIFFDMTKPQRSYTDDVRMIALSLRWDMLDQRLPLPASLHGTILPARNAGLLAELMRGLVRQAPTLPLHGSDYASHAVAALAAGALSTDTLDSDTLGGSLRRAPERALRPDHAARFRQERITRHIAQHLADPLLNSDKAADALGLSRSTVNRSLTEAGGFSALLLDMRLDRMRGLLRQAASDRTVSAIAHSVGFTSISYATRCFHARFGLPPRQWREEHRIHRQATEATPGTLGYLFDRLA